MELDTLEGQRNISIIETNDWVSPIVIIPKLDGNICLCINYKTGVNESLVNVNYLIRRIDDILNNLRNSIYFCYLHLYKGYLHLQSIIQTLSTHRGTYRVNRLSFGINASSREFKSLLDQVLRGLPKTLFYFDDIIVHGITKGECEKNIELFLQRLKKYGLN
ncbi:endonuclease [Caerostris darwini]|uniref:Endonuclease n=1 Tax=Caerostris darwini TaxID=1538125 RepID=A0AAV4VZ56_9ARAC|nr:endonuclease [Caerostris darwini]